jgi:hypothetical protein
MPHINATVDPWMEQWIRTMHEETMLPFSRLLREIIAHAKATGYSPGRVALGDMRRETRMRAGL